MVSNLRLINLEIRKKKTFKIWKNLSLKNEISTNKLLVSAVRHFYFSI
jgi:hypothetical protein